MFGLTFADATEFLAIVLLATIIALQGIAARRKGPAPVYEIECPNRVDSLWPAIRELGKTVAEIKVEMEAAGGIVDEARDFQKQMLSLHKARDADGIPRWYSRDQGRAILAEIDKIQKTLGALETELEIRNRLNGNGGRKR